MMAPAVFTNLKVSTWHLVPGSHLFDVLSDPIHFILNSGRKGLSFVLSLPLLLHVQPGSAGLFPPLASLFFQMGI